LEESVVVEYPTIDVVSKAAKRLRKQLLGLTEVGRLRPGEHCTGDWLAQLTKEELDQLHQIAEAFLHRHLLRPTSYRDFIIVILVLIAIERGVRAVHNVTTSTLSTHASTLLLYIQFELVQRTGVLNRVHPMRLDEANVEVTYSLVGDVFQASP
jgi:hypothetical protein